MRNVEKNLTAEHELKVNGEHMGKFRYADDQALLSRSHGLKTTISAVKKHSEEMK